MADVATEPDDGCYLGLDAGEAVGLVGYQLWPTFGQGVAERGGTTF